MPCLDEQAALALLEGQLTRAELSELDLHLDVCVWCQRLVAEIGRGDDASANMVTLTELEHGAQVGRFTVGRELGSGTTGVVYVAHDPELARDVALKLLHYREPLHGQHEELLLREARMMARLSHPNLVPVYEVGRWEDSIFVAMEVIEGGTLREWLARKPRTHAEILRVCVGAGRGLAAAHDLGLIHRDLKPENILVGGDARARVSDFGLAYGSPTVHTSGRVGDGSLTSTGGLVGTPAYMAPEQLAGRPIDARSDQFSFCVLLYEALAGQRPFTGATISELREAIHRGDRPRRSGISSRVWRTIVRGLRADPAGRFPSMHVLLARLEPRSPRLIPAVATCAAVVAITVAVIAVRGARNEPCRPITIGVWNDVQGMIVHAAFLRTGSPIAADTFEHVDAALDRYAAAWTMTHTDSCRATRVHGEASEALLDRRMSCLADRRGELAAVVDLLARADGATVEHAPAAIGSLVAPASCAAPDDLADPVATDQNAPDDVAGMRAQLQRAIVHSNFALVDTGTVELTSIIARAERLHLPRLRAEALYTRGVTRMTARDDTHAISDLEEAMYGAEASKLDGLAARASGMLIAAATDAGDLERARRWVRTAEAAVARVDHHDAEKATLAAQVAWLDMHEGRVDRAETEAREAVESGCRGQVPATSHCAHLDVLATVLVSEGKWADAVPLYRKNLALIEQEYGAAHPVVARVLDHLADALGKLGHHAEALQLYDRAFEIAGPADSAVLAGLLDNSAAILMSLGNGREAEVRLRRALAMRERIQGVDHPDVAINLLNFAKLLDQQQRGDDAARLRQRALAILETKLGSDHPLVASTLDAIGWHFLLVHQPRVAEPLLERARAIQEKRPGRAHPDYAYTLALLGSAQLDGHEPTRAVATFEEAIAAPGTGLDQLANLRFCLANALWDSHLERPRARALAATALAATADPAGAAEIKRWLASHP